MKKILHHVFQYLQKIGRSLILPVAVLPAAAILMGIGYWIDPTFGASYHPVAHFLFQSGGAIINNMPLLFAAGVGYGLSKDKEGVAALSGVIAFLVFMAILSPASVASLFNQSIDTLPIAFDNINNQFVGILAGIIAGHTYNRFSGVELPKIFSFFSGKRLVPIVTSLFAMTASVFLLFVWPFVFGRLMRFGVVISELGIFGVGLFGFFNRLLVPLGLHHALNAVFWFDGFGIADLQNFYSASAGTIGITGRYMAGFFPIMMFGLPGAALAIIHASKKQHRHKVVAIMLAAGFTSFFTGVTEPIEFSFLFVAPLLFVVHALFTGVSMMIAAAIPALSGFGFSAGLIDYILSLRNQYAVNAWLLPVIGIGFSLLYYVTFRALIVIFDLKTLGRLDSESIPMQHLESITPYHATAIHMLEALGGKNNIAVFDHCVTRLRLELNDMRLLDVDTLKQNGALAVVKSAPHVQVVIGPNVQFIASEMKQIMRRKDDQ